MPLTLRPNITSASRQFDHLVMSGELCVGRIYKREPANSPETQWLWAINGVQPAGSDVMRLAGMSKSLDEAQTQLTENWRKWLAWANLQEVTETNPPEPRGSQSPRA